MRTDGTESAHMKCSVNKQENHCFSSKVSLANQNYSLGNWRLYRIDFSLYRIDFSLYRIDFRCLSKRLYMCIEMTSICMETTCIETTIDLCLTHDQSASFQLCECLWPPFFRTRNIDTVPTFFAYVFVLSDSSLACVFLLQLCECLWPPFRFRTRNIHTVHSLFICVSCLSVWGIRYVCGRLFLDRGITHFICLFICVFVLGFRYVSDVCGLFFLERGILPVYLCIYVSVLIVTAKNS